MIKLTKKEAIKFHKFLSDIMISNHKWEILQLLDKIIGYCPNKKKETMHGRLTEGGAGEDRV